MNKITFIIIIAVALFLVIVGVVFKAMHWPGATVLIGLGVCAKIFTAFLALAKGVKED